MNRIYTKASLICPECGNVFEIVRNRGRQKELFHLKRIYCYKCKREINHIEAKNLDFLIEEISRKPEIDRTIEEQKVYQLVRKRDSKI